MNHLPSSNQGPEAAALVQDIEMNIRIRITREVAVEVGRDMVVTGIIGVKESIATEAGAVVQVLIIINPARGVDMMMSGVVGAGHMEVPLLLGIALNLGEALPPGGAYLPGGVYLPGGAYHLGGAHLLGRAHLLGGALLLVGHLQGVRMLMGATGTSALLPQKMFHHMVDVMILQVLPLVNLMLMNDGLEYKVAWDDTFGSSPCICVRSWDTNTHKLAFEPNPFMHIKKKAHTPKTFPTRTTITKFEDLISTSAD